MPTMPADRRGRSPAAPSARSTDLSAIVEQGLLMQAGLGTVSAVEFLKAHDVCGAVTYRVLSRGPVRATDHDALARREA